MPFASRRAALALSDRVRSALEETARSNSEPGRRVQRARILLAYAAGRTVSAIARELETNRPKVERCVDKALQIGARAALADLARKGRPATIPADARRWVVRLACANPRKLGFPRELWTTRLLASHVRSHCEEAGHPSLARLASGTVSKILAEHDAGPSKIEYFLERRRPESAQTAAQVLFVYKVLELGRDREGSQGDPFEVLVSKDGYAGIQAVSTAKPNRRLQPDERCPIGSELENARHRELMLLAGLDLASGHIHRVVVQRHRSREFVGFLRQLDRAYPTGKRIRLVLDSRSANVSANTRAYLATVPNRFDFVFTPKHGSWLNLVEAFFDKMMNAALRGKRVHSATELRHFVEHQVDLLNEDAVFHRWPSKMNEISVW